MYLGADTGNISYWKKKQADFTNKVKLNGILATSSRFLEWTVNLTKFKQKVPGSR